MLPKAFQQQMCALLGDAEAGALCTALLETAPVVSLRTNPLKPGASFADATPVPWSTTGCYLAERPSFTRDPLLHAGAYYVQEAASMLVELAYRVIAQDFQPHRLLDLCAAPGGKSTLWRSLLPTDALLVANEPMRPRAQILAENLTKWGHPHVVTTNAYPAQFASLVGEFDVVAADVPCSGEGMFRKDEDARSEWSPSAVASCAKLQRTIIADIWPALRTGGYLVYSTCTYNREENEDNVDWICRELGAELIPLPTDAAWGLRGDTTGRGLAVYHAFPHLVRGEGFFLALLRKTADTPASRPAKRKPSKAAPIAQPDALKAWLTDGERFSLFRPTPETITAIATQHAEFAQRLHALLPCLTVGVRLVEEKGKKRIPQHALALSTALAPTAFPQIEVSREQALAYLHREAITLPPDAPRGYVLIAYEGHPLGFANNLGNRANNLYPQEWRIRSL